LRDDFYCNTATSRYVLEQDIRADSVQLSPFEVMTLFRLTANRLVAPHVRAPVMIRTRSDALLRATPEETED